MYLTEAAIDASLRAVASWSTAGSVLAMTYMTRRRMQRSVAVRAVRAVVRSFGEPFRFGWNPDELPGYLAVRGFALTSDVSITDAGHQLLPHELAAQIPQSDRVAIAHRTA
jgi:O-methyltransferase involved in polyketide biosynthesis